MIAITTSSSIRAKLGGQTARWTGPAPGWAALPSNSSRFIDFDRSHREQPTARSRILHSPLRSRKLHYRSTSTRTGVVEGGKLRLRGLKRGRITVLAPQKTPRKQPGQIGS